MLEKEFEDCLVNGEVGVKDEDVLVLGKGFVFGEGEGEGSKPCIIWGPLLVEPDVSIAGGFGFDEAMLIPADELSLPLLLLFSESGEFIVELTPETVDDLTCWEFKETSDGFSIGPE